jgi:hypothetical protein
MTDPNVTILNGAWSLLWRATSPYYLPAVLAKGGTFGSTHIPPLTTVAIPDSTTFQLYSSSVWGNVTIQLTSATVTGLPDVQPVSFLPSADARSVTATVSFTKLTFGGSYEIDGTGVVGCAMDLAESQAYNVPVVEAEAGAQAPPANMDLARGYRDELVRGANGVGLVGKYYDHNDTINLILRGDNAFAKVWPNGVRPGAHNTAYYMGLTANAATPEHRGDPDYTVGGNDTGNVSHGVYMQTMLVGTCNHYISTDPDRAEAYRSLRDDAAEFRKYTDHYPNPMTVDTVLAAVQNTTPLSAAELAAVPEPEVVREARLAAERDFPELQRQAEAEAAARAQQAVTYKSTGKFKFEFAMPTLTFSGTVVPSGIPPNLTLTATLTSLKAAIPSMKIDLITNSDPTLTADTQGEIDNAQWFQNVLGSGVNAQLGSPSVLSYLSGLINQAIVNIIGG